MISRHLVLGTILLASSATACTLIVLGNIGNQNDYKDGLISSSSSSGTSGATSGGTSGATSSGGSAGLDECSLLRVAGVDKTYDGNPPAHDSTCVRCIQDSCSNDVRIACNKGQTEKSWFNDLKTCAQRPYAAFPDPDAGPRSNSSESYGCRPYEMTPAEVSGDPNSDAQEEYESQKCVHDKCVVNGKLPPCRLCAVSLQKSETDDSVGFLATDPCGKCFNNCMEDLIACCDSRAMSDYVKFCSYTSLHKNRGLCNQIRDAGDPDSDYINEKYSAYPEELDCAHRLGQCFLNHCKDIADCQPDQ